MQTYTIYTQCEHCGVYDRDPRWCTLCQRPKEARRREKAAATPAVSPDSARLPAGRLPGGTPERLV